MVQLLGNKLMCTGSHSSTLKLEGACSTERLVFIYKTSRCQNVEYWNVNTPFSENLRKFIAIVFTVWSNMLTV